MRKVIFHYHLFKNAGTSVDELLEANFPNRWVTRDFNDGQNPASIAQLEEWIQQEKDAVAFSSHTTSLPPPKLKGIEVFPIIFVRHPVDRIVSAYGFELKQNNNTFGSTLARHTTLAGYIDVHLSFISYRQCRDFHAERLARMFNEEGGSEITRALRAIEALPFVGLVDRFDQSINRMSEWLAPHFPGFQSFPIASNVTRDLSVPLEQRLEQIKAEIGEECYARLLEANAGDLAVYDAVRRKGGDNAH